MQHRPLKDFAELESRILSKEVDKELLCESVKAKKKAVSTNETVKK
jgi:hypothetical protein